MIEIIIDEIINTNKKQERNRKFLFKNGTKQSIDEKIEILPKDFLSLKFFNISFFSTLFYLPFYEDFYKRIEEVATSVNISLPSSFTKDELLREIKKIAHTNRFYKGMIINITVISIKNHIADIYLSAEPTDNKKYAINKNKSLEVDFWEFSKTHVWINYFLKNFLALPEKKNIYDYVIFEKDTYYETLKSNFLLVKNNEIYIPQKTSNQFRPVLYDKFLSFLEKENKFNILKKNITKEDFKLADEMYLINDFDGIIPIKKLQDTRFSTTNNEKFVEILNNNTFDKQEK